MNESNLHRFATRSLETKGRQFKEAAPSMRSEFQRDRDRIIHSTAFRRLEYKTQVFVNQENDLFRTRLTHSLEVAQIARTIARNLFVNEDLSEAIALAHDLGHTPFGHAGQEALNICMKAHGGFEHNLQSLRIVDYLEQRYADFDGLNLCFETREGILKHCSIKNAKLLGDVGERFLNKLQPSIEAQIANYADEIAYNHHDIDDGLRSGLLTIERLNDVKIWRTHYSQIKNQYPYLMNKKLNYETIRSMINTMVKDLISISTENLKQFHIVTIDDVRQSQAIVTYSLELKEQIIELKKCLFRNLYKHPYVVSMAEQGKKIIYYLFNAYFQNKQLLPKDFQTDEKRQARAIADYIAGMTDRYAFKEYSRITMLNR